MKDALMKLESNEPGIVGNNNASAAWTGPLPTLTAVQWVICGVAGLGFAFDLYESLMTALIVGPVLTTLGHLKAGTSEFNLWVGLFFFLPAVTGGIFGLFGGYLTDLLGRRRVLVWSILLYGFSACAASFANSLPILLVLRCTTMIGVCVEAIAAIAWLAELFPIGKQREAVLGYTQACYALGGLMVSGAYYLAVAYGEHLPAIFGSHEPWRYTASFLAGISHLAREEEQRNIETPKACRTLPAGNAQAHLAGNTHDGVHVCGAVRRSSAHTSNRPGPC